MRRALLLIAALLSLVLIGVAIFSFVTVRKSFPDTSGTVTVSGLSADVTIKRDAQGIPQIYADTPEDLFFAQGFVQAQDRFFEMDFRRHVTAGRLAELVGDGALDTDKYVRTLGWRRVAEQELSLINAETRALLDAYASGVNSYIEGKSGSELSLEYAILSLTGPDYRPEPWGPVDSMAWIKAMAWDLRSNMTDEIGRTLAAANLTVGQVEELYPAYPSDHATIVGDQANVYGGEFTTPEDCAPVPEPGLEGSIQVCPTPGLARAAVSALTAAQRGADALPALLGTGDGIGSNSWVVSGQHTKSGRPILANDPHLAPSMPGIWYQLGLHCRSVSEACPYDVAGFSFAGLPGVVVGHNNRIAWGVTTMYADVADLVLEKITGDTYLYDGKQVPLTTRQETFEVAGGEAETITVRSTRHGPILSDLDDDVADVGRAKSPNAQRGTYAVALQWTALTPEPTIEAVFALDTASNWDEFRAAAEKFTVPSQNLVYADVDGNIGYQSPGTIPIRGKGDGRWPVPGWKKAYDWTGTIPFDALPSVLNPDEGFIVTANNDVIGDQYPLQLGADTAAGYRSERIRELIESDEALTVAKMQQFQFDSANANAEQWVPKLLEIELESVYYRQGQDTLRTWDRHDDADSAGAAYFNVVWRNLLELTFHDELVESQWPTGSERWFNVMSTIIDRPSSHWWDDVNTPGRTESRDEMLAAAMRQARDELTRVVSREPGKWTWGKLHQLELVNPTLGDSGIGPIEALFNRGGFGTSGGGGIVNATSWDATEGYEVTAVPSMRMVVDMSDLDQSSWIQLTGNSGHAFHQNYLDQFPLWNKGESLVWAFSPKAVDNIAQKELILTPKG